MSHSSCAWDQTWGATLVGFHLHVKQDIMDSSIGFADSQPGADIAGDSPPAEPWTTL